jgi:hypothetical protein
MITRIAKINNDFLKYALYRIYALKSQMVIMMICGILSFPLIMFAVSLQLHMENTPDYYDSGVEMFLYISIFLSVTACAVLALLTYTGGVNCYDYYNRRERADMSWSLPIKNRDRFWGDFAAGIVPIAVTYIISAALGLLIMAVGFPKEFFENTTQQFIPIIVAALFAGLLTLISIYIITVFCAAICGRVYETAVYPALIFIIIPAIIALFGNMVFYNVWQVSIYEQLGTTLAGTSPGGFLIGFFAEIANYNYWDEGVSLARHISFLNPAVIIPFVLVNGGFLGGAYYLARRRGAEKTGQAFVFKHAQGIILSFVVFCITALFCINMVNEQHANAGAVFGLIMCTAIAFLILDVSAKRGFKKMGRAGIKYTAMLVGSVIVSSLLLSANGFGIGRYVPPLKDVKSAAIDISYLDNMRIGFNGGNYFSHSGRWKPEVEFTGREEVELIRRLNTESNEVVYDSMYNIPIFIGHSFSAGVWSQQPVTYTLNNGNKVTRNLRLDSAQMERLLPLIMSDDFKMSNLGKVESWLLGKEIVEVSVQFMPLWGENVSGRGTAADTMRLYEAFRADYFAETFEQRFYSTEKVSGSISFNFSEMEVCPDTKRTYFSGGTGITAYVLPHYTNLIAELERQGFDLSGSGDDWRPLHVAIIKSDYIGASFETTNFNSYYWHYISEWDERTTTLARQLFDVMQPMHMVQGEGYLFAASDKDGRSIGNFVIPPEYSYIAEELYTLAGLMEMMRREDLA